MLLNLQNYIQLLKSDPVNFLIYMAFMIVVILLSLILHECAHGWMALRCGDPTAKMLGRLSLNPARHLDPIGTIFMFLFGFGWARPVPVNPRNFENFRRDDFLVSIAGIVTNLTLFIFCSLCAVLVNMVLWNQDWLPVLEAIYGGAASQESLVNIFASGNVDSIASYIAYGLSYDWLEGFTNYPWLLYLQRFLLMMAEVNLTLAIFNLLPIPPLDGYHLVNDTLLKGRLNLNGQAFRISQFLLIILLVTDVLDKFLIVSTEFVGGAVIRTFLMMTGQG